MIRLAFVAVLGLGAFLAFLGFQVASIEAPTAEGDAAPVAVTEIAAEPTPAEPERLFFLQGVDFDAGEVTLLLSPDSSDPLIVRDQAAMRAAMDSAYVATDSTPGQAIGSFVLALMGAPPEQTIVEIYQNDLFLASVQCLNTTCGDFADSPDINLAGLDQAATPYQPIADRFDDYDTYLAALAEVQDDRGFLFLDNHRGEELPTDRQTPYLIVSLPNVVTFADSDFAPPLHEALVEAAITPLLPDGATLGSVTVTEQAPAVLSDLDSNAPVLIDGQTVPFPGARFFEVSARIDGVTGLDAPIYDQLTEATLQQVNLDDAFDAFVAATLPDPCEDCYFLKIEGIYTDTAKAFDWREEAYYLYYYDLRDPP
ncbi:MAG: hypothetical protein AAGL89_07975 [Pseudomonadota bacterium]